MRGIAKKISLTALVAVALIGIGTMAAPKLYYVRDDGGGEFLWSGEEAYLFFNVAHRGVRLSYLEYTWAVLKQYLGGVPQPDDERQSVIVIQVTPSAIERHVVEINDNLPGAGPGFYTPLEGRVYANYPDLGGLCRWAGDHFELATEEDRKRLNSISRLTTPDIENVSGWSRRAVSGTAVKVEFAAEVGQELTLLIKNDSLDRAGSGVVSIDLQRLGQNPERIWGFDGRPRRVSKTEYEQLFYKR